MSNFSQQPCFTSGSWLGRLPLRRYARLGRAFLARKIAGREIASAPDFLDAVFRTSPALLIVQDKYGAYVRVNDAVTATLGYTQTEMLGCYPWDFLLAEEKDREEVRGRFARTAAMSCAEANARFSEPAVRACRCKSGEIRRIEWSVRHYPAPDGRVALVVATGVDRTQRVRGEAELRQSEARFRVVVEQATDGIFIADAGGRYVDVNPAACAMLGYTREELLRLTVRDVLASEEMSSDPPDLSRIEEGVPIVRSRRLRRKDGRLIDVEIGASRLADGRLMAVTRDLTTRQRADEALRASEERFSKAFNAAPAAMTVRRLRDDMLVAWNPAFKRALGYSDGELTEATVAGMPFYVQPGLRPYVLKKAGRREPISDLEVRMHRSDGSHAVMLMSVDYITLGSEACALASFVDVTAQKQAEAELKKNESRLRDAQRLGKIGSWELEPPSNRLVLSDEIHRIFEIDPARAEVTFETYVGVIHPDDRAAVNEAYARSLEVRQPWEMVHRLLMADGRVKIVHERGETDFATDGTPLVSRGTTQDITAQWLAEDALRKSEQRLQEAQAQAHIGSWEIGLDGQHGWWSDENYRIFSLEPRSEPVPLERFLTLVHPDDREALNAALARCAGGSEAEVEYRIVRPDGEIRHIQGRGRPIRDGQGRPVRMAGTNHDITERVQAERALRVSEARLQEAVRVAGIGIVDRDHIAETVYRSPEQYALFGYGPDDSVPAAAFMGRLHPEDADWVTQALNRSRDPAGDGRFDIVHRIVRPDGAVRWIETRAQTYFAGESAQRRAVRTVGATVDITERVLTEQALAVSEGRLQQAVRVAGIGIYDRDHVGDAVFSSPEHRGHYGIGPDEPVSRQAFLERMHPEDAERVERAVRGARDPSGDGRFDIVHRIVRSDGEVRWLETRSQTFFEGEGARRRAVRTVGAVVDITDRVLTEQALGASERRLRQAVRVGGIGIFDHDQLADTIYWSPEQRGHYGLGAHEPVTLQGYLDRLHPEDAGGVAQAVVRAHDPSGDGRFDIVHRIVRRDGAVRWLETRSQTFFEGEGGARRPVRTVGAVVDITERVLSERARLTSEERLQVAIAVAGIGIFDHDQVTESLYWSPEMRRHYGAGDEAIPPLSKVLELAHPEDAGRLMQAIAAAHDPASDGRFDIVYRIVRPDGEVRWLEARSQTFFEGEGAERRAVRTVGAVVDITAKRQAEEEAKASRRLLDAVVDQLPFGLAVKDAQGRFVMVNRHLLEWTGAESGDFLGRLPSEVKALPEGARERSAALDRQVLEGGMRLEHADVQVVNRHGGTDYRHFIRVPIKDEQGRATGLITTGIDVTQRVLAERELRNSRHLLQSLIDTVPDWLSLKDRQGRFQLVNRALAEFVGKPPEWFAGRRLEDLPFQGPAHLRNLAHLDAYVLREEKPYAELEAPVLDAKGGRHWFRMIRLPWRDERGALTGVVAIGVDITARRAAEQELKASQRLLNAVVDHLPFGLSVKDTQGRFVMVNRRMLEWTEAQSGDFLGKRPEEVEALRHGNQGLISAREREVLATGALMEEPEVEVRRPGRETVFQRFIWVPIKDEQGKVTTLITAHLDITQRVLAEQEIRRSRHLLQSLIDTLPDMLSLRDREGLFLLVNRALAEFVGRPPEWFIGRTLHDMLGWDPAYIRRSMELDRAVLERGEATVIRDVQIANTNGERRWFHMTRLPWRDEKGNVTGVVNVGRDVTAGRHAEAERARLATAVEHSGDGILVTDRGGLIEYVNPAFEAITGYSRLELLGHNPRIFQSGRQNDQFYDTLWNTIQSGATWHGRYKNRRKTGELHDVESSISSIRGPDGEITNFVAVYRDVTQQVRAEERMQRMQRMEALGALAGGIAHDFNNLLSPILGYAELLNEEPELARSRAEYVQPILDAGRRARDLIGRILQFSRRVEVPLAVFDPAPVIREVLTLLRSTVPATVEIRQKLSPDAGWVCADPGQLHQVAMNLCVNAVQAMPEGGVLTVALENAELHEHRCYVGRVVSGRFVALAVSDTGSGMTEEVRAHIFEPFFTTKEPGKGTGLGLSTVFGIVQEYGGAMDVESASGQGSTFRIYLPGFEPGADRPAGPEPLPQAGSARILLVDDERSVLKLLETVLTRAGYSVAAFADPVEALERFKADPQAYDLAVADLTMPGMSGDSLSEALRTVRGDLPLILCTGNGESLKPERIKQLGIAQVLLKPVGREPLLRAVRTALHKSNAQADESSATSGPVPSDPSGAG